MADQTEASGPNNQQAAAPTQPVDYSKPVQSNPVASNQPKVTPDERLWAALSYIPLLALLALLIKPNSQFLRLHGRQGLLIFVIFFFSIFLYIILPPLGALIGGLIQMALFLIGIYSAYQAFVGNWWKIPLLGNIAESIPVELFTKTATQAITGQTPSATPEPAPPAEEPTAAAAATKPPPAPEQVTKTPAATEPTPPPKP